MKKIILIGFLAFNYLTGSCQTNVSVDSLSVHLDETVKVCSKVYSIKNLEKVTFINVGAKYPNSPLTLVIFAKDRQNFKSSIDSLYSNKQICVTGKLQKYKDKIEIVLSNESQIHITE